MGEKTRKYKINDYLDKLTVKQYRRAVQIIPKVLGVSLNTFHNYRNILCDDVQDIPYEKVIVLEMLFEMMPGELSNNKIKVDKLQDFFS